jgi:hypothetical protein
MPVPANADWEFRARIYSDLLMACAILGDADPLTELSARSVVCFFAPFIHSITAPLIWDEAEDRPYPIAGQLLSPATTRRLLAIYATIDWNSLKILEPAVEAAALQLPEAEYGPPLELVTSVDLLHEYLGEYARLCRRAQELNRYTYIIPG